MNVMVYPQILIVIAYSASSNPFLKRIKSSRQAQRRVTQPIWRQTMQRVWQFMLQLQQPAAPLVSSLQLPIRLDVWPLLLELPSPSALVLSLRVSPEAPFRTRLAIRALLHLC